MSHLIKLEKISLSYGLHPLLDQVDFAINPNERICLIGRNGMGKSSLLKIIEGVIEPDSGNIWRKPQLRLARLAQELPTDQALTVYDYVASGLAEIGQLLADYNALTTRLSTNPSKNEWARLNTLQRLLDSKQAWQYERQINSTLNRLNLLPDTPLSLLSGGWLRRAALAKALVSAPDILLLDEPTNHLDIDAIQWLEEDLLNTRCTLVFITHDRALLQRLATRIIELDRGHLSSWPGDYEQFLIHKKERLHAEEKAWADFDKKLAEEETWIRQGIKARRTRNEGRVRALEAMRFERAKRRALPRQAQFNLNSAEKSGQLVIEAQQISHGFTDKSVIKAFSLRIMRGDRIGLIGPNGVGKSTLLSILLGELQPDQGRITLGTQLKIAYFDQRRQALNLNKTVLDNVAEGQEYIEVNGRRQHIMSYMTDFLFTPERARTPAKALSGGELNRLLLARLFKQPANLLVMDEPTNDLDIETLELLEDLLTAYQGTLLLVSHDRTFLDNVITSALVFKGDGVIEEQIGGYAASMLGNPSAKNESDNSVVTAQVEKKLLRQTNKLSYKEQQELAHLPLKIEQLEAEQQTLQAKIASEEFYQQSTATVNASFARLSEVEHLLSEVYQRWYELDSRNS